MASEAKYLETLFGRAPELGDQLNKVQDYHRRRLWHQLTICLTELVKDPVAHDKLDLVELYKKFIASFETKLNQLSFVRICVAVGKQLPVDDRIAFLKEISELPKVVLNSEAFVDSRSVLAELAVVSGKIEYAKEVLNSAKSVLDKTAGADITVYSNYFRAWAAHFKLLSEPEEFYKYALQYVAYTPLESLEREEVVGLAFDLGLAALLGENIFNFGDLLEHPLMDALHGTENQWLADVIFTFNRGQITKWKELQNTHSAALNKQSALRAKHELLDDKIAVMSLVEHVFHRPADDRNIPFADIATACDKPLEKVEILIMRALSLGLIKGVIDEVDGIFTVTWVQPRILNKDQITQLNQKLTDWGEKVKNAVRAMESGITSELVS